MYNFMLGVLLSLGVVVLLGTKQEKQEVYPTFATVSVSFIGDSSGTLVEPKGWYRCSDGEELGWCPPTSNDIDWNKVRDYIQQNCRFNIEPDQTFEDGSKSSERINTFCWGQPSN